MPAHPPLHHPQVAPRNSSSAATRTLRVELASLGSRFSNNVVDASAAWDITVTDPKDVEGIPAAVLRLAAQSANTAGKRPLVIIYMNDVRAREGVGVSRRLRLHLRRVAGAEGASPEAGPWRFTLDLPSYVPFMQHCPNPELREAAYRYETRSLCPRDPVRMHARLHLELTRPGVCLR